MGSWAADSFGNDTACDWAYSLEETSDLGLVRETLQKVLDCGDDSVEAPDAEEAIAAAETVARLKGNFGERNSYTEPIDNWVAAHPQRPPPDLVALSIRALDRILTPPSELLELWQEGDEYEKWRSSVTELKDRVSR